MFKPDYAVHPSRTIREHINILCDGSESIYAEMIHIPRTYVRELVEGRIHINEFIAEKLSRCGGSKQFWLNLQENYDRDIERLINEQTTKPK
jgi:plasmid maintenance system antidote protein VapI